MTKLIFQIIINLGGNSKTLMFANIGPADYNYDETLGSLRYVYLFSMYCLAIYLYIYLFWTILDYLCMEDFSESG